MRDELRDLLPTWAVMVLLPVPMTTFWTESSGRAFAYGYLFVGAAILTAESFGRGVRTQESLSAGWRTRVRALALALAATVGVFTVSAWAISGDADATVPILAALAVLPAIGCVPYLTLVTRRPYAAVLFAVVLLVAVKLLGCVVVRVVYGPDAQARGEMSLPFEHPNFLVWFCIAGALVCSGVLYGLGRRAFARP